MTSERLPVAVIGAGPVGLAAVAHLVSRGERVLLLEAGDQVGASVRKWAHVRLFSPWKYNVDGVARSMLEPTGWRMPDPESAPTGRDLVERYLQPLADLPQIKPHVRLGCRVVSVSRQGFDKMKTEGREQAPFLLHVLNETGEEQEVVAKAVIDASGTYLSPNPLGAGGTPALGERALAGQVYYGIPDVLGVDRARYRGRRVLVVGSGHSAMNALISLAELAGEDPAMQITWAVRRSRTERLFGGGAGDALPARGRIGTTLSALMRDGALTMVSGFRLQRLTRTPAGILVDGDRNGARATIGPVDEIIAATGARPDLGMLRELRLDLDPAVESPSQLAPMIDPNHHSCGTVRPHGFDVLRHHEPDFYVVGSKSYGRAPTFLMLTGYEQVRSIVAAIAGDMEAAAKVELVLPETGVCSVSDGAGHGGCCAPAAAEPVEFLPLVGAARKSCC